MSNRRMDFLNNYNPNEMDSKWDQEFATQVRTWMETVTGKPFPHEDWHQSLKSGVYLCELMNILQPNSIPKINTSQMVFREMENIGYFLEACRTKLNIDLREIFQTVDLYDSNNMPAVLLTLGCVGRKSDQMNLPVARYSSRVEQDDPRDFTSMDITPPTGIGLQMENPGWSNTNIKKE